MNKYLFIGLEIFFCILYAAVSYRPEVAGVSYAGGFFIGSAAGTAVWLIGLPYLLCCIFARKSKNFHRNAFIISLVLFVLLLVPRFNKSSVSSNISALNQAYQATEEMNYTGNINQFKNNISKMTTDKYSEWQKILFLSLSEQLENFTKETKINIDLFSAPQLLSSKTYLSQAINIQKKRLASFQKRDIHADLDNILSNIQKEAYQNCIQSYTSSDCSKLKQGLLSGFHIEKLESALKIRAEYLQQEVVLAELILNNYAHFDKTSQTPRFKTKDLQNQLVTEVQKLIKLSEKIETIQKEALQTSQKKLNNLNNKYR